MIFEHEGEQYKIVFKHEKVNGYAFRAAKDEPYNFSHVTRASIFIFRGVGEEGKRVWERVVEAPAFCSTSDHFVKEVGRQIALKRAVANFADRAFRGKVLSTYFKRKEKK